MVVDERTKFTLTVKRQTNDKLMDVAKELAEFLKEPKYGLSFIYKG